MDPQGEVTSLLAAWGKGDPGAINKLMPLVYAELHRIARRVWHQHQQNNTLQPTALINEAYLKLANAESATFQDRCHFFAVACTTMREAAFPRNEDQGAPVCRSTKWKGQLIKRRKKSSRFTKRWRRSKRWTR